MNANEIVEKVFIRVALSRVTLRDLNGPGFQFVNFLRGIDSGEFYERAIAVRANRLDGHDASSLFVRRDEGDGGELLEPLDVIRPRFDARLAANSVRLADDADGDAIAHGGRLIQNIENVAAPDFLPGRGEERAHGARGAALPPDDFAKVGLGDFQFDDGRLIALVRPDSHRDLATNSISSFTSLSSAAT